MNSAKSITNMALSTATMCAFAIPPRKLAGGAMQHVGGKVAAFASGLEFFVNLLWPDDEPVPDEYRPLSIEDLQASLQDLVKDVQTIIESLKLDLAANDLETLTEDFHKTWSEVLPAKDDTLPSAAAEIGSYNPNDPTQKSFIDGMEAYFDLASNSGMPTTAYRYLCDLSLTDTDSTWTPSEIAQHQSQVFPLFLLLGSLLAAYLKAAVTWRFGSEVAGSAAWLNWAQLQMKWDQRPAAYKTAHPGEQPVKPPKCLPMPSWQEWRKQAGCPVNRLIDEIGSLLAYAEGRPATADQPAIEGLYPAVLSHWNSRLDHVKQVQRSDAGLSAKDKMSLAIKDGALMAYQWQFWTDQYGLGKIEEVDIANFQACIEQWKNIRDSVRFSEYTVRANQTSFKSVAYRNYDVREFVNTSPNYWMEPDQAAGFLADRIYEFNKDAGNPNSNPVVETGLVLKIPELDPKEFRTGANSAIVLPPPKNPAIAALSTSALLDLRPLLLCTVNMIPDWIRLEALAPSATMAASGSFADLVVGAGKPVPPVTPPMTKPEGDLIKAAAEWIYESAGLAAQSEPLRDGVKKALRWLLELHENWSALLTLPIDSQTFDFPDDLKTRVTVDQLNRYTTAPTGTEAGSGVPFLGLSLFATKNRDQGREFGDLCLLSGTLAVSFLKLATIWQWGNKLRRGLKWNAYQDALKSFGAIPNNPAAKPELPADAEQCPDWLAWASHTPAAALAKTALRLAACSGGSSFGAYPAECEEIIASWKQAGSHVVLHWHTVHPKASWDRIIGQYYDLKTFPKPVLAHFGYSNVDGLQFLTDLIVTANSDRIKTPADLAAGQVLAIPCVPPPQTWLTA